MRFGWVLSCFVVSLALGAGSVRAQQQADQVDLALILAVDVSSSVDEGEAGIQRTGYIAAMRDPKIVEAIRGGLTGKIVVTYVEWASPSDQRVIVPWRTITDAATAAAFATELEKSAYRPGSTTSISAGIDFCVKLLNASGINAIRRVIDMSGDGYSDYGRDVRAARDDAVKAGIIINGLPVMNERAPYRTKIPEDLDTYYKNNVTGGRGAFTLAVKKLDDFNKLILQKLILEIASLDPKNYPG